MKIESMVCTLEQSKILEKLGIEQECRNWYYEYKIHGGTDIRLDYVPAFHEIVNQWAAWGVAELGVMMPEWHFSYPRLEGFASYKNENGLFVVADGTVNGQNYDTEAECRAALVIYLIENNILSIQTCNSRLLQ